LIATPIISLRLTIVMAIPLMMYILMVFFFGFKVVKDDDQISLVSVLKTYPILHISYGLGYFKGVLDFIILGKKPSDKQKRLSR